MNDSPDMLEGVKKKFTSILPYGSEKYLSSANNFFSSNTLIAKATFLMLIIILFSFIFYIGSRILFFFLSPNETPMIVDGMKDATEMMIVPQALTEKSAKSIYRSRNQYDGIEFTYSLWIYVNNLVYKEDLDYKHVFHKGSANLGEGGSGLFGPNSAPGVYLYTGRKNLSNNLLEAYPELGMLVRLNVYHDNDRIGSPYKYYDDIAIDGIPIKKWVGIIIRVTSQNIVDIYINGTLTKRHKLSNIVKQNYDNLHINMNGGFLGNLSNLKYYNYAINTFEIDNITQNGPNLKTMENSNLEKSKPEYLSSQWYFSETDPLSG